MLKLVLDSNILVSAFLTPKGEGYEVLRQAKAHKLYLSPFILSEIWQTLHYPLIVKKYRYQDVALEQYLKSLASAGIILEPKLTFDVCPDPKDNLILACAVEASADYLVTRNIKHFPSTYEDVVIVRPTKFLQDWKKQ